MPLGRNYLFRLFVKSKLPSPRNFRPSVGIVLQAFNWSKRIGCSSSWCQVSSSFTTHWSENGNGIFLFLLHLRQQGSRVSSTSYRTKTTQRHTPISGWAFGSQRVQSTWCGFMTGSWEGSGSHRDPSSSSLTIWLSIFILEFHLRITCNSTFFSFLLGNYPHTSWSQIISLRISKRFSATLGRSDFGVDLVGTQKSLFGDNHFGKLAKVISWSFRNLVRMTFFTIQSGHRSLAILVRQLR